MQLLDSNPWLFDMLDYIRTNNEIKTVLIETLTERMDVTDHINVRVFEAIRGDIFTPVLQYLPRKLPGTHTNIEHFPMDLTLPLIEQANDIYSRYRIQTALIYYFGRFYQYRE